MLFQGECVTIMIRAIWSDYENLPNSLPVSSGTNTRDFLSFFLFWLCSLPAIWFPVHKIRHLFTVKAYFVPVAGVIYFIWAVVKAHGIGPIVHQPNTVHGSALAWAMIKGIMSSIANFATLYVTNDWQDPCKGVQKAERQLMSITELLTTPTLHASPGSQGTPYGLNSLQSLLDLLSPRSSALSYRLPQTSSMESLFGIL